MPSLSDLQGHVRDTVLGADATPLKGIVADDRLGYDARLNVYRNNTTILLGEALAANFPIVHDIVGTEYFANLARAFVRTNPPCSPCLHEYGADFAEFLAPGLTNRTRDARWITILSWAHAQKFGHKSPVTKGRAKRGKRKPLCQRLRCRTY